MAKTWSSANNVINRDFRMHNTYDEVFWDRNRCAAASFTG